MNIELGKLKFKFNNKPIIVGGMAMEYYGLRKSGPDVDLIVTADDLKGLILLYPTRVKDLYGDLGVCPFEFEIWKTINYRNYEWYREGAVENTDHFIVSLEKLLIMKAMVIKEEKYLEDLKLTIKKIIKNLGNETSRVAEENRKLLEGVAGLEYIRKTV